MIQWNDLIQRLGILFSSLFPKLCVYQFLWTACASHSAQWDLTFGMEIKSQILTFVEPLWAYTSTPKVRVVLPSTDSSSGVARSS